MGVTNIGNETRRRYLGLLVAFATTLLSATALADGIVATVVSSPLSSTGTVSGYPTGINIYLQSDEAQGYRFMDPAIEGYGVPAGGRIEVEMLDGFERIADEPLEGATLADISLVPVSGTPQQSVNTPDGPLVVSEGANPNTFVVAPVAHGPVTPDDLTPGVPGSAQDAIQNRGIKVFHVGINPAFRNVGESGTVAVRIYDGDDTLVAEGTGTIDFLPEPGPQIFPTNLLQGNRNHNWQRVAPGATVGQTDGTVPLSRCGVRQRVGRGRF